MKFKSSTILRVYHTDACPRRNHELALAAAGCGGIVNGVHTTGLQQGKYHRRGCTSVWAGCT